MTREELVDLCYDGTDSLDVLERADASWLADQIIDDVINELRAIAGTPKQSHYDWLLVLGDLRRDIEDELTDLIDDRVELREAIRAIVAGIEEEGATP
jgi:hypothetical protein